MIDILIQVFLLLAYIWLAAVGLLVTLLAVLWLAKPLMEFYLFERPRMMLKAKSA